MAVKYIVTIWRVLYSIIGSNTGQERVVFVSLIGEEKANGDVGASPPRVLSI
jgi:hypothetical protein